MWVMPQFTYLWRPSEPPPPDPCGCNSRLAVLLERGPPLFCRLRLGNRGCRCSRTVPAALPILSTTLHSLDTQADFEFNTPYCGQQRTSNVYVDLASGGRRGWGTRAYWWLGVDLNRYGHLSTVPSNSEEFQHHPEFRIDRFYFGTANGSG